MSNESRQPAGVPAGGQFATTHRAEVGTELDAAHAAGAVDLDAWEPGEDVDDDSLVAEELRTLRARVAEYEKAQQPPGPTPPRASCRRCSPASRTAARTTWCRTCWPCAPTTSGTCTTRVSARPSTSSSTRSGTPWTSARS